MTAFPSRGWRSRGALCFALALCGAVLTMGAARAETRAIVVGIDRYKYINTLRGAENDAKDIAGTLEARGVRDISVFDSGTASRRSVLKSLDEMVARTHPGDLVIIAFAGHGASETWGDVRPADAKLGEHYTVFLLPDFAPPSFDGVPPKRGSFGERILGREMNARLALLERKGARTIFIADTCHGGGLTREVPPEVEAAESYRYVPPYPTSASSQDRVTVDASKLDNGDFDHLKTLPNLTFLAAVDKTKKAPEVQIPPVSGPMRGALSYSFARAVEGAADTDHDGKVTRDELFYYTRTNVRQHADRRQEPELQPTAAEGLLVIDLKKDLAGGVAAAPQTPASRQVRIFVPSAGATLPKSRNREIEIISAGSVGQADLIWEAVSGQMSSAAGDLIAEGVGSPGINAVAEREIARRELLALAGKTPLEVTLDGGDGSRREKDLVVARVKLNPGSCPVNARTCPRPYYVVFNIAGNGQLQYLFPRAAIVDRKFAGFTDPLTLDVSDPVLRMRVNAPYGTDTLVVVTSPEPMLALAKALSAMDGQSEPLDVIAALKRFLPRDALVATQAIFTRP